MKENKARVIAFYLPQYHPIPENDKYWGKGFTEWTNVAKAKPLFRGHYQPHIPADLGFYDLRLPEVREAQAELVRDAGIEGFCYYHYWFGNGKMLLQKPFEEVLRLGKPDFPFCLCWANHDWTTKTWVKGSSMVNNTMIAQQEYLGEQDDIKHFEYCLRAFKDHRYITIEGKPIFLIYDPLSFPNVKEFMNRWNFLAKKNNLKGIYFIGVTTGRQSSYKIVTNLGFDGVCHNRRWEAEAKAAGFRFVRRMQSLLGWHLGISLMKYDYNKVVRNYDTPENKLENCYPVITPGFDRTPRAGRRAGIYVNSSPKNFKKHVAEICKSIQDKDDDHRLVFLSAWNEWGEGNYMEPDLKWGHGYLEALKSVVKFQIK